MRGARAYTLLPSVGIRINFAFCPSFCAMSDYFQKSPVTEG